jgi:predicted O-methyltransferase YrrM
MKEERETGATRPMAERVDEIASGYRGAQILMTGVRLGLFEALAERALTAGELAHRLEADPRGTRILADALVALGLLDKSGGTYRTPPEGREVLVPGTAGSKTAILHHAARLYERWGGLYDAVKTGSRVPDERSDPRLDGGERGFARAMADVGRATAAKTVEALASHGVLEGVSRALDVGGGPGLYAIELARARPGLRSTVLDRAETLEVARANVEAAGLDGRVTLRPGDAVHDELGGELGRPWDLVFASNFVHIYSPEDNRGLVGRAAAALAPGGRLVVKDFLLDPERTTPPGGALFAVNMLVNTEGGDCYTVEQVHGWFREAGLEPGEPIDLTPQSRLAVGWAP